MLIKETWGHYLEDSFKKNLDRIALIDVSINARYTYRDILIKTQEMEKAFIGYGVKRGTHVVMAFPSSALWVSTFLALINIGAVPVCINNETLDGELRYMIDQSKSRIVITDEETYVKIRLHEKELDLLVSVVIDRKGYTSEPTHCSLDKFLSYGKKITASCVERARKQVQYDDILTIQYTSGTTGLPKAVMSVHYKVLSNIVTSKNIFEYNKDDKILSSLPMYHVMGCFFTCLLVFLVGGSLILMRKFNTDRAIEALIDEKCTGFHGVPTMYKLIMNKMGDRNFESLSKGMIAGSYCDPETMKEIIDKMGVKDIQPLYGQSEGSGYTQIRVGDPIEKVLNTVGRPVDGVEIKIVDDHYNEVPTGCEGEILVHSLYTMAGYYRDQEATDKVIKGDWIYTGDLGKVDEEGYVSITGRKKDIIIRGGENISPVEIEAVLRTIEYIQDVVVVGVEDEIMGQEIGACVILNEEGKKLEETTLISIIQNHSRNNLSKYKTPKHIRFVDRFPLTGSGKIQKTKLAKIAFAR